MSVRWRPNVDEPVNIESWLPIINSIFLFLGFIGFIIYVSISYEHTSIVKDSVIKNQHIDHVWTMMNTTHLIENDMKKIHFASVCCKKNDHLKCFNANIRGQKLMIPNALHGYSCSIHFPR